jgi:hypothetical protein
MKSSTLGLHFLIFLTGVSVTVLTFFMYKYAWTACIGKDRESSEVIEIFCCH